MTVRPKVSRSCLCSLVLLTSVCAASDLTLTARIDVNNAGKAHLSRNSGNVVVWLSPVNGSAVFRPDNLHPIRLTQRNKSFEPHLLIVPVGSVVEFPNRDPFFHNVFSLFEGKRFDLGLYEAGGVRNVRFDKVGISYIFCNIHAEMSAVVIAIDTPYYGISNQRGEIVIPGVPTGRYTMQVWSESALPETLKEMTRQITVSESTSTLGVLRLAVADVPIGHKNKYGHDYESPGPSNPAYQR